MRQSGNVQQALELRAASTMKMTELSIALARSAFQLDAVDDRGKTVKRQQLGQHQVAEFFANHLPRVIDTEAFVN